MNVKIYTCAGEKNSINFTPPTKEKEKEEEPSKLETYGIKLLTPKSRLVPLICYIKMPVTENLINKILEPLNNLIFVLKLSNILMKRK